MDIFFQSGDFYNSDTSFLKDIFGALIGTGTALLIFYLQIKNDKKKELAKKNEVLSNKLDYFATLIEFLIKQIRNQNSQLDKVIEKFKNNNTDFYLMDWYPNQDLYRITDKLNQEDYFEAYLSHFESNKSRINKFKRIYSSLDYFAAQYRNLQIMFEKNQKFDYERRHDYQIRFNRLMDEIAIFVRVNEGNQNDLVTFLADRLATTVENNNDPSNLAYFQDTFVNPVKYKLVLEYGHVFSLNPIIIELKNLTYIFSEIKMNNDIFGNDLSKILKISNSEIKSLISNSYDIRRKYAS